MTGKKDYKTVSILVTVPVGLYCLGNRRVCEHVRKFEGGFSCALGFYPVGLDDKGRALKPEECLNL